VYLSFPSGNGAVVLDVSADGLGFQAADSVEPNQSLPFRLSSPGCPDLDLSGQIAWLDATQRRGGLRLCVPPDSRSAFAEWQRKYLEPAAASERPKVPADPIGAEPPPVVSEPPTPAAAPAAANNGSSVRPESPRSSAPPPNLFARQPDPMFGSHGPVFVSEWELPPQESRFGRNLLVLGVIVALCLVVAGGSYLLAGKREMGSWLIHIGQSIRGTAPQASTTPVPLTATNTAQTAPAAPSPIAPARPSSPIAAASDPAASANQPVPGSAPPLVSSGAAPEQPPVDPSTNTPAAPLSSASTVQPTAPQLNTSAPAADTNGNSAAIGNGAAPSTGNSNAHPAAAVPAAPVRPQTDATSARQNSAAASSAARAQQGETEFAQAQRYLATRTPQDAAVAAELLWSAIGNGNTQAELALGDLYLRGRGVQRSCRQAEILFHAALAADVPSASQKIQELQTYGCR
jgi:hypothetical protein